MRPLTSILVPVLALLAVAAPPAQARPSVSARMTSCVTAVSQPGRFLVAEGSMRRLKGASRMQIRFELQSRTPERAAWNTLSAPGFGVWNTADPSVRRYVYQKRVQALAAPADYRMVVQFRWLDGSRTVAQQRKVTGVCRQPDVRPDLTARDLNVKKGGRYAVKLANSGGSPSGPFSVVLVVNGTPLPAQGVGGLAAGGRSRVEIIGPSCAAGSTLTVRVDPDGRVDERDEAGNELVRPCPG